MNAKKVRWRALAEEIQRQNDQLEMKCLRDFMKLSHLIEKYFDVKLNDDQLNRTQRRVLVYILAYQRPMTPTELSRLFYLNVDTINKSVDSLDKLGLTRSYRSRTDRRVRKVALTDKGLDVMEKTLPQRQAVFSRVMGGLDEKSLEIFLEYTQKLLNQVDAIATEIGPK